jgi:hypothetical protein
MIGDVVLDVCRVGRGLRNVARQALAAKEDVIGPVAAGVGPTPSVCSGNEMRARGRHLSCSGSSPSERSVTERVL